MMLFRYVNTVTQQNITEIMKYIRRSCGCVLIC